MASPASTRLTTPLCQRLGIAYPIVQAPMAGVTTPELVAAVSGAGGLGMLAGTRLSPDQLHRAIAAIRQATDRPFGVNFLVAGRGPGSSDVPAMQAFLDRYRAELGLPPGPAELPAGASRLAEQVAVCVEARVSVLSFALGDARPWLHEARRAGVATMAMATTVADAELLAEAGADVLMAQGAEAGGHRSLLLDLEGEPPPLVGTMALVPQVVDAVRVPVVAAGGIADGRGVAAALALGAQAAALGTRFIAAAESAVSEAYRAALIAAVETDTAVTAAFTGRPARALRNRLQRELEAAGPATLAWPLMAMAADDLYTAAARQGAAALQPLYAGQALRLVRQVQPAAAIVQEVVQQAEAVLAGLAGLGPRG